MSAGMNERLGRLLRVACPDVDESTIDALLLDASVIHQAGLFQDAIDGAMKGIRGPAGHAGGECAMPARPEESSAACAPAEGDVPLDAAAVIKADGEVGHLVEGETLRAELSPGEPAPSAGSQPDGVVPASATHEAKWPPVVERKPAVVLPPSAPVMVPRFVLRNMRQAEFGEVALSTTPEGQPFELVDVRIPAELGLETDLENRLVRGTPQANGEFVVAIQFRVPGHPELGTRTASATLLVNADPKLLWKDIASDTTDRYWKQDKTQQLLHGPDRKLVAARQRGRSHAHVGSFCDDDFHIAYLDSGWYVNIVADGAGSAKFSRHGSRLACEAAGGKLAELLAGDAGEAVVAATKAWVEGAQSEKEGLETILRQELYKTVGYAAHAAMKSHTAEIESDSGINTLRELSTTLLIGVAREIEGRWLCAAYWVGDGAVGVYRAGEGVEVLGEVDSGEYSGQTRFLDANEVSQGALWKRIRHVVVDDFTAFVLMTDGVSDAKFETEAKLMTLAAWDDLWADLESGAKIDATDDGVEMRLQTWLDFWSPGNHDDRTISILY